MKKEIHPKTHQDVKVKCICGAEFDIVSTNSNRPTLDVCAKCHPAYNDGMKVEKAARWRLQAYQDRMAKIEKLSS